MRAGKVCIILTVILSETGQEMERTPEQVSLFLPCLADLFYPAVGRATIRVLKKAGLSVSYPKDQTCCGQWAFNLGHRDAARAMARHFIRVFESAPAVVCPSGSCVLTVRDHYPELFIGEPEWKARAEAVGARTFELSDFLVNVVGAVALGTVFRARATVHDSCHPLRGLGLKDEPRTLLGLVEGLELVEMAEPEVCCGFGGAFMGLYAPLSKSMAEAKIDQALETGAEVIVISEPGCLLNVASALEARGVGLKAVHLAQVLAGETGPENA